MTIEVRLIGGGRLRSGSVTFVSRGGRIVYVRLDDPGRTAWLPIGLVRGMKVRREE